MKTFYVLDHKLKYAAPAETVKSSKFEDKLLDKSDIKKERLFIIEDPSLIKTVLSSRNILKAQGHIKKNTTLMLVGEAIQFKNIAAESLFKKIFINNSNHQISIAEIFEILKSPKPQEYVISGLVDSSNKLITLVRGSLESLVVPFSAFSPNNSGVKPNFNKFFIEDFGQTLKFGEYEATLDSVLYEYDSDYRKKINSERAASEKTFGACLRRLRIQKGYLQNDFTGITDKEIRRIELGEIKKPHKSTIEKIAKQLNVSPEEILEY